MINIINHYLNYITFIEGSSGNNQYWLDNQLQPSEAVDPHGLHTQAHDFWKEFR